MTARASKTAVVLFNLGGPDAISAVKPFLFNLFYDPAITELPAPLRWLFAKLITRRRLKAVEANYMLMGGKTPLLEETTAQARALERELASDGEVRCFVAMRYWHPFAREAAQAVKDFAPDRMVLLPLYPQYSNATTGSSLRDWGDAAAAIGLAVPARTICCYPTEPGFVAAHAGLIRPALEEARAHGAPRLLFSAHGLPEAFIAKGDPYQWQVEQTCAKVVEALGMDGLDWVISYQSRVGPQKWIEPYTEVEVERAGHDKVPLVMVPIAFVSEHIETLVEMDDEYREVAVEKGVPHYRRVPTLTVDRAFIGALAQMVRRQMQAHQAAPSPSGPDCTRVCPAGFGRCPCRALAPAVEAAAG